MTDRDAQEQDAGSGSPRPLGVRIAIWTAATAGVALALWGMVHVTIPPVNPARRAPSGHYGGPCWACHIVSDQAPLEEGD